MAVNLTAPFLLGQRFGPGMAARGWGRIINVTSQQSLRAFGHSGGYGASKARARGADPLPVGGVGQPGRVLQRHLPRLRGHAADRGGGQ